jgi:hypothetical protein
VFAVLDFMALLKSLQRDLTCTRATWAPVGDPRTRRLVNEIVLGEESDELPDGTVASHFELYVSAMDEAGADSGPARRMARMLADGHVSTVALAACGAPAAARSFSQVTWSMVTAPLCCRAAAFAFSREEVIPDMFAQAVARLGDPRLARMRAYLERHIEVDADSHGPASLAMVAQCCGHDAGRWRLAGDAAEKALAARRKLWDDVAAAMR